MNVFFCSFRLSLLTDGQAALKRILLAFALPLARLVCDPCTLPAADTYLLISQVSFPGSFILASCQIS